MKNVIKQPCIAMVMAASSVISTTVLAEGEIQIGHLTYHTGEYGGFGEFFDAVTDFSLEVINDDPPLGRKLVPIHQDIGTIGEARAARKLIDSENVDVLLNAAHSYMSYRDYVLEKVAGDNLPSMGGTRRNPYSEVLPWIRLKVPLPYCMQKMLERVQ